MTDRDRRMMWIGVFLAAVTLLIVSGRVALADEPATAPAATGPTTSSDWPQWRGPTRDGIVHGGPKLLDSWPKGGPPLLWKSGPIPGWPVCNDGGGSGSVSVSGGRAFVFAGTKAVIKLIDTKDLIDLGWEEGIPDALGLALDKEDTNATRDKWKKLKPDEWDACVKEYMATLNPDWVKKFGPFIEKRMNLIKQGQAMRWHALMEVAAIRGKNFSTWQDLLNMIGELGNVHGGDFGAARGLIQARCWGWTDNVICLDAATGGEIWRKVFPGRIGKGNYAPYWPVSCTPAIWDDKCYTGGSAGFYCLSVKDGSVVWQVKATSAHSSPLVAGGAVFFVDGADSRDPSVMALMAYDARDGKVLWRQPRVSGSYSSPVMWTGGGKNRLVVDGERGPFLVNPDDGAVLWQGNWDYEKYATPSISGNVMAIQGPANGSFTGVHCFRLAPEKMELLWKNQRELSGDRGGGQIIYQGYIYLRARCSLGSVICVNLKTGEVEWGGGNGEEAVTPIAADGKLFIPTYAGVGGGHGEAHGAAYALTMFRATPDKYEELGKFCPYMTEGSSAVIAGGKLFLRCENWVACYDLAEHRPYMAGVKAEKDELVFDIKQAEGGLAASNGAVEGLTVTDAAGKTRPAKAHVKGDSLAMDIKDLAFPIKVAYADSGNLGAKNGPLASFEWRSRGLAFERCEANALVMRIARYEEPESWKAAKDYTIVGAKVTDVEIDPAVNGLRLTADKAWKSGEKITLRYPAFSPSQGTSDRTVELPFTVTPGHPVDEKGSLGEFLIGELRENIDPKTILEHDDLDKTIKPVAGEKWKVVNGGLATSMDKFLGSSHVNNALVHACDYLHAEADCKVQLSVYCHGGVQAIVNGQSVFTSGPKGWKTYVMKDVQLKKGWNTLLLGLTSDNGLAVAVSIRNEQGNGPPVGLRYTTELPKED